MGVADSPPPGSAGPELSKRSRYFRSKLVNIPNQRRTFMVVLWNTDQENPSLPAQRCATALLRPGGAERCAP